ncbi:MAG: replication protein RepA [Gallionella sp.]|nr:replication protein RepA [Gallionella sp.]
MSSAIEIRSEGKVDSRTSDLIARALEIEAADVKASGQLGFMARALAQTTLPHSKVDNNEFERTNGIYTLSIHAPRKVGLPYGAIPRILTAWISTEAVIKKSPDLVLGNSLRDFMSKLGLSNNGGKRGDITRLKSQARSLFSSVVSIIEDDEKAHNAFGVENIMMVRGAQLLWNPRKPDEAGLFDSHLSLTEDFFKMITDRPVPIDLRVLHSLRHSPLAMDIYVWSVYRLFITRRDVLIPWLSLKGQFGANYAATPRGRLDFKREFIKRLNEVIVFYPQANIEPRKDGLLLAPSTPHIPPKICS